MKRICKEQIEQKNRQIAFNFDNIDFIDSVALGALISCNNVVRSAQGKFFLMNLSENIYDLLEMTSVDKMFTIIDSERDLP